MRRSKRGSFAVGLFILTALLLFPIALTFFTSFAAPEWVTANHQGQQRRLFTADMGLGLAQYRLLFSDFSGFLRPFLISVGYAGTATVLQIVISFFVAYCFAQIPFKGSSILFFCYMAAMLMPPQITLLPSYIVLNRVGLINNWVGLILPAAFAPFGVFFCGRRWRASRRS